MGEFLAIRGLAQAIRKNEADFRTFEALQNLHAPWNLDLLLDFLSQTGEEHLAMSRTHYDNTQNALSALTRLDSSELCPREDYIIISKYLARIGKVKGFA